MTSIFKSIARPSKLRKLGLALVAAVSVISLQATPAWSQGTGGSSSGSSSGGTAAGAGMPGNATGTSTGTGSTGMGGATKSGTANGSAKIASADRRMLVDLIENNYAEIESGKAALDKATNPQVKKFAQQMIDDHTKALSELQTLAQSKGVEMPDGPGIVNKTKETALKAMSGDTFDKQYTKRAGIDDHEKMVKLLQKIQKDAKDPELKAEATKMLPTVQEHLQMAKAMPTAK